MAFSLSVIIPAYNERDFISNSLDQIVSFLSKQEFDFEIIVVYDGSLDNTSQIVEKRNDVKLITLNQNMGKGFAVKTGVLKSNKDYVLFMDADHAIPINYILDFKKEIGVNDIVIGSKYLNQTENYPFYRKVMGNIFSKLKYIITGLRFKDSQCGFKLFKNDVAKDLFKISQISGWCFDVEILLFAQKKIYTVKEPIELSNMNATINASIFKRGAQMFVDLVKLKMKFKRGNYEL